jgi:hypothetical protein
MMGILTEDMKNAIPAIRLCFVATVSPEGKPNLPPKAPCAFGTTIVRRVVHELHVPDAALMRFLKPLKLRLEEVEPFHITHDCGLPCFMCRRDVGRRKRPTQAVVGDHLIHPGETFKMVLIKQVRLGYPHSAEDSGRIPAEDRTVRHVGEACDRERPRSHVIC